MTKTEPALDDLVARRDGRERFIFFTPPVIALMSVVMFLTADGGLRVLWFAAVVVAAVATGLWVWGITTCLWMTREIGRRRSR